ncbi:MAG: type II toxin-antitoxin system Phd/YefM family antitoxin [Actinomycetia bacterium]|nr:type II toxin-antitoxin system Phd/YefM family antitoxin [Actinomycetes bacterium]
MTAVTSQEFNRNPTSVKRKADEGPVYITERGRIAYVVTTIDEYRRLTGAPKVDLVTALQSGDPDDDYDIPVAEIEFRPVDL